MPREDRLKAYLAAHVTLRADAGFPSEDLLSVAEEQSCSYVCRFTE